MFHQNHLCFVGIKVNLNPLFSLKEEVRRRRRELEGERWREDGQRKTHLSLSLSLSHTHTHTHTHSLSLALSHLSLSRASSLPPALTPHLPLLTQDWMKTPDVAGFPVGAGGYWAWELNIHYDNPTLQSGIYDNSKLKIYLSRTPREHAIGVLQVCVSVSVCLCLSVCVCVCVCVCV